MDIQISMWGNSLGFRIPATAAKSLKLKKGSRVTAEVKRGKLVISPADDHTLKRARKITTQVNLKALLKTIKPGDLQQLEDDAPVGKEIW